MTDETKYLVDLHHECGQLESETVGERVRELSWRLRGVSLSAVGGFPFVRRTGNLTFRSGELTWCGSPVTMESLRRHVTEALGLSGVLTFANKGKKSLHELGEMCAKRDHSWGLHWINATLVFARFPPAVELAFARDNRFYLSWPVNGWPDQAGVIFAATAGLKEWRDYLAHRDNKDFDLDTRIAMNMANTVLGGLLP